MEKSSGTQSGGGVQCGWQRPPLAVPSQHDSDVTAEGRVHCPVCGDESTWAVLRPAQEQSQDDQKFQSAPFPRGAAQNCWTFSCGEKETAAITREVCWSRKPN